MKQKQSNNVTPKPGGISGEIGGNNMKEMLSVGTEIYNHGDMANCPHFGTIVEVSNKSNFPAQYKIKVNGEDNHEYWVLAMGFSKEYKGNGSTRLVTKEAYKQFKNEQIRLFNERYANKQ